jgi:hypothetical protein
MRTPSSSSPDPVEVAALKPEVLRLAIGTPLDAALGPRPAGLEATAAIANSAESAPAGWQFQTRLKFVQVGLWEARRRWLAGQTQDLGVLLAHLDEDLELLGQALAEEVPPTDPPTNPPRCRETAPVS